MRIRSSLLALALAGTPLLSLTSAADPAARGAPGEYRLAPYEHYHPWWQYCDDHEGCKVHYYLGAVWVGDLTGDGRDDILTALDTTEIWIIPQLADGSLGFDAKRVFRYGDGVHTHAKAFVLGDFNEDGALDMAGNYSTAGLGMNLLLSDGAGGHALLEYPVRAEFEDTWQYPFATDVDRDGHLDVGVLAMERDGDRYDSPYATFLYVQHGDGTGQFPRLRRSRVIDGQVLEVEMGDVDGDGHEDMVMCSVLPSGDQRLALSLHDGRGSYRAAEVTGIVCGGPTALADFDGDEEDEVAIFQPDARYMQALSIPRPDRTAFEPLVLTANVFPYTIIAPELDRDGRPDLFTTQFVCQGIGCSWTFPAPYLNLATGWTGLPPLDEVSAIPQSGTEHPNIFAWGDINSDGCTDIVTAHGQEGLAVFRGLHCVAPARRPRSDFDGDGAADLVWRHAEDGRNVVWLSGRPTDSLRLVGVRNAAWEIVAAGDFDGDSTGDLFWRNRDTGANALWPRGRPGTGRVATVRDPAWRVVGAGDFDGDGRDDLFWRHAGTGENSVWPGAAPRRFAVADVPNVHWRVVAIGDFNGDRSDDLFWRNDATGRHAVWWAGSHVGQTAAEKVEGSDWRVAGAGDLDGDRRDDLVWRNAQSGANVVWRSADSGTRLAMTDVTNTAWAIEAVDDFSGDGVADVMWRHRARGTTVVWRSGNHAGQRPSTRVADLSWQVVPAN